MDRASTYAVDPGFGLLMTDLGIAPADVFRRAGLPADLLSHGPAALAPAVYFELWTALEAEAADPDLPIRIGRAISVEVFQPPIFAAICSRDLNVAAERIARHKRLIGPVRVSVTRARYETTIETRWPGHLTPPASLAMTHLVFWVALVRLATRTQVRPLRLTTPEPPQATAESRTYLGTSVDAGPANAVTFSAADAARPFLTANEPMWEFFEPELRRRLSELETDASVIERVRGVLLESLPTGDTSIETVARDLMMSPRTLQRRLQAEGITFQAVLNDTREDLARHYLSSSNVSVPEISFLLGYDRSNSFFRAFRSWTGQTPERVRSSAVRDPTNRAGSAVDPVPAHQG